MQQQQQLPSKGESEGIIMMMGGERRGMDGSGEWNKVEDACQPLSEGIIQSLTHTLYVYLRFGVINSKGTTLPSSSILSFACTTSIPLHDHTLQDNRKEREQKTTHRYSGSDTKAMERTTASLLWT